MPPTKRPRSKWLSPFDRLMQQAGPQVDANGDYIVQEGLPLDSTAPRSLPRNKPTPSYTPPRPSGRDANGDYFYPGEGGVDPRTYYQTRPTESSTVPQPRPAPPSGGVDPGLYYQTHPTESSTLGSYANAYPTGRNEGGYTPQQVADIAASPATAPTSMPTAPARDGTASGYLASGSGRPSGNYSSVSEIMAEKPPQTNDPKARWKFNEDRFDKLAAYYNVSPEDAAKMKGETVALAGDLILSGKSNADVNALWESAHQQIASKYDFNQPDINSTTTQGQGQGSGADWGSLGINGSGITGALNSSIASQYGIYSPQQIASIQASIGQYVNQSNDAWTKATGIKADPRTSQAYMAQAQMLPVISAYEGQAALAQQLAQAKEQLLYYQLQSQIPRQTAADTSSSGATGEDMYAQYLADQQATG